ncbi:Nucleoside transporter family protein [Histomonas meleagridis]|uniref:Nucleoside transporter family protein n=1 Tax=Histomonas meleagridis TaxID=135588 RepID=UPI00355A9647|nr:Nucleoside transporter family protein [Histomonas meleagridis]KAH0796807.1 Nucleoside transporter family protein [Histomonas meleagridis]
MASEISSNPLLSDHIEDNLLASEGPEENTQTHPALFFLLGNASLLAFNIIINAIDIYIRLTNNNNIGAVLNRFYNIPCSLTSLALCIIKPKNFKLVLIIALTALSLLLVGMPLAILIKMSDSAVYWMTMILSSFVGIFSACIFSSSYSIATQVSPQSTGYISSGNGCCGVIAAVLRIVTKAAFNKESLETISSAIYFFLADAIIIGTLIYLIKKLQDPLIAAKMAQPSKEEATPLFSKSTLNTIKIIWPLWLSEFCNYMITLSLFPGYVSQTKDIKTWTPVIVTSIFCVFDWVGRYLPAKFLWPSQKWAWIPILFRLLSYPIFMLSLQGVINLGEPYWTFLWMIPFATSNGYFGTVVLIHGSNHSLLTNDEKRFAGLLMSFAVNAGILMATIVSFGIPTPKSFYTPA